MADDAEVRLPGGARATVKPADASGGLFPPRVLALLAMVAALAFWARREFIISNGGLEPDYVDWALKYYFGGITPYYVRGAEDVLHLRAWSVPEYPPGYSVFLAFWKAFGIDDLQRLRGIQAGVDSLTVFPLYYVLRRVGAVEAPSLLACGAYAVAPLWAFGAGFILAEALSPLLVVGLLAGMWMARDRDRPAGWLALGLAGSLAAMIRPDLLPFAGVMGVWALGVSARRGQSAALILAGFALPVLLWGAYNRVECGHWILASSAANYALWAGLGQVPNHYGYFVSDAHAYYLLKSHGIQSHSPQAEAFWGAAYRAAWRGHPAYVLRTLAWRLSHIPFDQRSHNAPADYFPRLDGYFTGAGAFVAVGVALLLTVTRRYAAAFMVMVPLGYAELTLGLLYYEPRYIRYVPLSYVLAAAVAASLAWQWAASRVPPRRHRALAVTASVLLFAWAIRASAPSLKVLAREAGREATEAAVGRAWEAGHRDLLASLPDLQPRWIREVPDAAYALQPDGLHLTTDAHKWHYQIAAPIPTGGYAGLALAYDVQVEDGGATVAFLAADGSRFLARENLPAPGNYRGAISCAVAGMPSASVLVSNCRIVDARSRILIRGLKVYGVKR